MKSKDRFDDLPRHEDRVGAHRAEQPRMRPWTVVAWAVLGCVVLTASGIFAALVVSGRVDLTPDQSAAASQEPSTAPVIDTNYTVLVLNGTAQQGLAEDTKATIVASGWPDSSVEAGQSSATDFETTVVYYATPEDEPAAAGLAEVLGGARVEQSDAYQFEDAPETPEVDETTVKRLVAVIGLDRATVPADPDSDSG